MEEDDSISTESISLDNLASIRSIIINADTSDSVISSVFDFLTGFLSRGDPAILHHVLKLLSDLAFRRKELAPHIFESVFSNLLRLQNTVAEENHGRVAVESLAVLASLSERNPNIVTALSRIDGEVFASICLGAPISSRLWLLRNAERFIVPSSVLFTLFLGFTKDPYPYIRKVSLDGLINICKAGDFDHAHAVEGCYTRAVELLSDAEDSVRSSAVCAVSVWGKVMIASKEEEMNRRECTDAVFLQLCSIVRDMSVDVRVEVFKAFGIIGTASESIILQTLSKKVLGARKGKELQDNLSDGSSDVSTAAGVFIHGFEDEFYEVREAAVESFHSLSVNSIKFPDEAVYLLMDMLYDDYMVVRLKTLKALHHIANLGNLKIQESYIHAFLDAIVDTSENIRVEARKILKLAKLPDLKLVNKCVDGFQKCLEMYPQDEPSILSALFHFGQNHADFIVNMVKRFSKKLGTASGNKSEFNSLQLSASLMLIISAPLSNKQSINSIPPLAFSYSMAMLGKFSFGLHDLMDQDMLLAYLTHCTILSASSRTGNADLARNTSLLPSKDIPNESTCMASEAELEMRNQVLPIKDLPNESTYTASEGELEMRNQVLPSKDIPNESTYMASEAELEMRNQLLPSKDIPNESTYMASEAELEMRNQLLPCKDIPNESTYMASEADLEMRNQVLPSKDIPNESTYIALEAELKMRNQVLKFVNHILLKIKAAWLLSQSGCSKESLRALRACKQELATLTADSSVSNYTVQFLCEYIHVIELFARVWPHLQYSRHISTSRSVELELLMEEAEIKLMEIRCRFTGSSMQEESLVMELVIFGYLLRLYKSETCCRLSCMEKLTSTISQLELHHEQQCTKPSDLLTETKKSLQEIGSSTNINCCRLLDLIKIFNCFSGEQLTFSDNLQCYSAELEVPGNGPYNPIYFVPGLPVEIPCEITLHNMPRDTSSMWLRISRSDETCQFVYLDQNLYNGDGREKRLIYNAVTYMTPRTVVFTLRVSIGIECMFEDICYRKQRHGPKHPVAYLCKEREVHFKLVSYSK